ncbi:RNA polymerase sigma factor [Mucilaginibacter paludis]|uniref:RNA polymerase, sigma-24 subunit, ECF subfamily n=1 Tax=Mucilaginibacter paludis DSM 18603 TaxID=714943 RepID=H1Y744_9SPHI|nr:RNA polymerase sigma-70 factor [Mucilaginibacter paludis]EHQ28663.1 RNA polymerase, sigma-24 subunit, ECF subfamily [Mucilaginibacter paludis DSM 18603]
MKDYGKFTDNELVSLIKEGDHDAYTNIFERYTRLLVAHAFRLLGDQDAANDVVQDVFVTLWQNRAKLTLSASFSSYLYTATRNRVFNKMSHQKVVAKYAGSIIDFMQAGYALADEQVRVKELSALIEQEISALPPRTREIFLLNKEDELSYKEIALRLNITDQTAKQQVYIALKNLRLKLGSLISVVLLF